MTMTPLKPEVVERVLQERPNVTREDISEYERLVAARFAVNPHVAPTPAARTALQSSEARIRELHAKIFG
jgi:hypothetical protein